MIKKFKVYFPFSLAVLKANFLQYRATLILWMFYDLLSMFVIFFLWKAIFASSSSDIINGMTFGGIVLYYIISKIISYFLTFEIGSMVSNDIKKGLIAMSLIKPISYKVQLFFAGMGIAIGMTMFFLFIPIGLGMILNNIYGLGIVINTTRLLYFILSVLLSIVLSFLIDLTFASLRFFTINGFGVANLQGIILRFTSGALIPLSFLPAFGQTILNFLPFQYILYKPATILTDASSDVNQILLMQFVWILIMFVVSNVIWNASIKKAVIQGG